MYLSLQRQNIIFLKAKRCHIPQTTVFFCTNGAVWCRNIIFPNKQGTSVIMQNQSGDIFCVRAQCSILHFTHKPLFHRRNMQLELSRFYLACRPITASSLITIITGLTARCVFSCMDFSWQDNQIDTKFNPELVETSVEWKFSQFAVICPKPASFISLIVWIHKTGMHCSSHLYQWHLIKKTLLYSMVLNYPNRTEIIHKTAGKLAMMHLEAKVSNHLQS